MKKYILLYKILLLSLPGIAQLTTSEGVNWVNNGNVIVTLQNLNLVNNGNFTAGSGSVKFNGNQNSGIGGNNLTTFNIIEMAKTNGTKVSLHRNIGIISSVNFISGQLDLNGHNMLMNSSAMIAGESENNRILGGYGGFVEITQEMNAPVSINAGNLGATISSSVNLGSVTIRRGHTAQSGTGLTSSMNRYYAIAPTNNSDINATLRLKYFDAELNGQNENALVMYKSNNDGLDWNNMSQSARNTNANYVEKTGIASLTLQTLANDNIVNPDGATGVVLSGQRKKTTEVTLKWTSQTETNMNGYEVQRKLKNDADFSDRTFENSLAPGGNSLSLLSYQNVDDNSYTDTSYYRLKILTNNAAFTYSNIVAVPAKTKGSGSGNGNGNNKTEEDNTAVNEKPMKQPNSLAKKITVGPNPNNGNFWFSVSGIEKETTATLFYIDGKQLREFKVANLQQVRIYSLRSGIYILKVPGFDTQKIIVNGEGNPSPKIDQPVIDNIKL